MHYYEINFNPTEELANEWGISELSDGAGGFEDVLSQTFYVKSEQRIETNEQMKNHLLANFKPSEKHNCNLIDCIEPTTVMEVHSFYEIDAGEFESCCGITAD